MKEIVIVGAGGFGRETAWLIHQINQQKPAWNLIGFYDDGRKGGVVDGLPVLDAVAALNLITAPLNIVIAVADPSARRAIRQKITTPHALFPSLFHPSAERGAESTTYGPGCIITHGCILTINVKVGDFVIVNLATSIGHDVTIGNYTAIMPNCSISGSVSLGAGCLMGAGAKIIQGITIGDESVIGAGAVVTKSFGPKSKLVGVPAINAGANVERV